MYKYIIIIINFLLLLYIYYLLNKDYNNIYVKKSKYGGRGVFANKNFNKGDIIEKGYSIITNIVDDLKCGIYINYIYTRTDNDGVTLLLGNGSLYNHSYNNNAYIRTIDDKFIVYSNRNIKKGEEILICYGCNHPDKDNHYNYSISHNIKLLD